MRRFVPNLALIVGLLLVSGCGLTGYKLVGADQSKPMQAFLEATRAHDSLTYSWCALTLNGQLPVKEADKLQQYVRSMGAFLEAISANTRGEQLGKLSELLQGSFAAERQAANDLLDSADIGLLEPVDRVKVHKHWHLLPPAFRQACGNKIGVAPLAEIENPIPSGPQGMARETHRAMRHFKFVYLGASNVDS